MAWECMSAQSVGNLHFIDGIMNQDFYLNILKTNLAISPEKIGIKDDFVFTQDNYCTYIFLQYNTCILQKKSRLGYQKV